MNPQEFDHLLAQALDAQAPPPDAALAERIAAAVAADAVGAAAPRRPPRWQMPRVSRLAGATAAAVLALAAGFWLLAPAKPPAPPRSAPGELGAAYAPALLRRHAAAGPATTSTPRLHRLAQVNPPAQVHPAAVRRVHAAAVREARLAGATPPMHHWPAVFPSPAPPSPQERALLDFIATAPPRVVRAALTFPKPKWKSPAHAGSHSGPAGPPAGAERFIRSEDRTEP